MLVGITGNIGSGKSLFMRMLGRFGHTTYDADKIVDDLYRDKKVVSMIESAFGTDVVENDRVNRKALAGKVFNSTLNLRKLNNIVHPLVKEKIAAIKHYDSIVFVEVPLLFESKMQGIFDKVVLIRASHETCRQRAKANGFPEEEFEKRVAAQYAADRIVAMADIVVDSECSANELAAKAEKVIEMLKA